MKSEFSNWYQYFIDVSKCGDLNIAISFGSDGLPCSVLVNNQEISSSAFMAISTCAANCIAMREEENKPKVNNLKRANPKRDLSFIYLMRDASTGYIKIGRSKDPKYRESTLQSQKPTIELITFWQGSINTEKQLHEKYADKRIRGEWFSLSKSDVSAILSNISPIEHE